MGGGTGCWANEEGRKMVRRVRKDNKRVDGFMDGSEGNRMEGAIIGRNWSGNKEGDRGERLTGCLRYETLEK